MAERSRVVLAVSLAGLLAWACSGGDEGITGPTGGSSGSGGSSATGGEAGTGGSTAGTAGASGSSGSGGSTGGSAGSGGTGGAAGKGGSGGTAGSGTAGSGGSAGSTGGSAGSGGTAGTGGSAGTGGAGGAPPESMGCGTTKLLKVPEDTGTRGPWPVGAKTLTVGGLTTEFWYPATLGSESGKTTIQYDIRTWLPTAEQTKIPDVDNPWQPCNCYRDLPFDTSHGPYPVIIFEHGTAAWRAQSVQIMTHWASRGFVVISQDHPGLYLGDYLQFKLGANLVADTDKLLAELRAPAGDLQTFLSNNIDLTHLGMSGHSAGGGAISGYGKDAMVLVPLASGGVTAGAALKSTLVMGGQVDSVANYTSQQNGYNSSPAPKKRLVGIANAGHLNFSDICSVGRDKGGLVAIAQKYMVTNANLAVFLFDCKDTQITPEKGWPIINRATTAAFEETLTCSPTAAKSFDAVKTDPDVGEYKESL